MGKPLLSVENLEVNFTIENKSINVIDNVSFSIKKGKVIGLVGESGCGKSISSLSVMRLLPRTANISNGKILFDGQDILSLSSEEMTRIRGKEIGMIFQEPMTSLNSVFTIGNQLSESIRLHSGMGKKEALEHAIDRLKMVSIPSPEKVIKQYPHELSGGMRQRVMIAMAMSCDPKLLIADEPTTALDVTIQAQILDLIRDLRDETGASVLLITHDLGVVAEMCDYVVVMYAGRVVEEGDVFKIFENPKHPYTLGLLESLPTLNDMRERLHTIAGSVPPPQKFEEGCRFAPRCSHAVDKCFDQRPPLLEVEEEHMVSCFFESCEGRG